MSYMTLTPSPDEGKNRLYLGQYIVIQCHISLRPDLQMSVREMRVKTDSFASQYIVIQCHI